MVSVLKVLFVGEGNVSSALTTLTAGCLLVFSLLYAPCVAAVASIKREMGGKWTVGVIIWQCAVAWAAAFILHSVGLLAGLV